MAEAKYMVFNGEVIPFADGKVHIASPAVKYGIGVFEGVRGYWNETQRQLYVFRLRDHVQRLKQSMKLLRLEDTYSLEALEDAVLRMIRANEFRTTIQMRVMALLDGIETARHGLGPVTVCIQGSAKAPHDFLEKGLTAGTSSWVRPSDNSLPVRVKCNANYVNGRLAELEAKAGGFDRAILLNSRGKVSEGPGATMFIIRKGRPVTPSTSNDILESITRDSLITHPPGRARPHDRAARRRPQRGLCRRGGLHLRHAGRGLADHQPGRGADRRRQGRPDHPGVAAQIPGYRLRPVEHAPGMAHAGIRRVADRPRHRRLISPRGVAE